MEYDFKILRLSQKFIDDYPKNKYRELMLKDKRPYSCLLIDTHKDYFICIPFRSSIQHNNAYIFKNTNRSKRTRSGLDYSKVVLIKDTAYFDSSGVVVDNDEYKAVVTNIEHIIKQITCYIDTYVNHINGAKTLHIREFERKYKFSTLPYFHNILNLS